MSERLFDDSRNARDLIGGQAGFFDDDQELPQNLPGGLLGLDGRELANAEFIIRARALGVQDRELAHELPDDGSACSGVREAFELLECAGDLLLVGG